MTRYAISVAGRPPLDEIAITLERHRIKRVPVLRDRRLVGILSRAGLVQALAAHAQPATPPRPGSDDPIRRQLPAELDRRTWWRTCSANTIVTESVVHYWRIVDEDDEKRAARVAAENVPDVRRIEDRRMRYTDLPSMV